MRIAICEDDRQQMRVIDLLLEKFGNLRPCLQLSYQGFLSADELLLALDSGHHFDLYLLDILMPGVNGIDLAAEIRNRGLESPLVFITASADHALDAFNVYAMQYLLKPVKEEALFSVLDKAITLLASDTKEEKYLMVMLPGETVKVPYSAIVCVENFKRTLRVYLLNGERLHSKTFRGTFESATAPLCDDSRFLQVHKSYMINMAQVKRLVGCSFIMSGDTAIHVPRYKFADMKAKYFDYLAESGNVLPSSSEN
ncbi:MAG: LytTR family DNA-binding domain-containing protein [Defluviitaleaceae bacterium]|nr:LytTR family DNA-binding domain-containing protein [Defluviitaleaceae bacterium]